jgi:hypothetical protein
MVCLARALGRGLSCRTYDPVLWCQGTHVTAPSGGSRSNSGVSCENIMDLSDCHRGGMLCVGEPDFRHDLTWDESEALHVFDQSASVTPSEHARPTQPRKSVHPTASYTPLKNDP